MLRRTSSRSRTMSCPATSAEPARHLLPRRRAVGAALVEQLAARAGDRKDLATIGFFRADQALVLELRERGVHRTGTGAPDALASLLDEPHHVVAVARLLRA